MPIMSRLSLHPTAGDEKLATMHAEKDKEVDKAKKMDFLHNGCHSIKACYDKVMKIMREQRTAISDEDFICIYRVPLIKIMRTYKGLDFVGTPQLEMLLANADLGHIEEEKRILLSATSK